MKAIILLIVLPLLTAFVLPILHRQFRTLAYWAGPVTLLITVMLGLAAWPQIAQQPYSLAVGGFQPPLGITLYIDRLALLFTLAVHIGSLILWVAWDDRIDAIRRRVLLLILAGAGSGLVLSGDLFNIYVFYELLAVASYGLVIRPANRASYIAAIRYLLIGGLGAALILIGIALIYAQTGTLNLAQLSQSSARLDNVAGQVAFIMLLVGFGVKAEMFAVNIWVPEVYATTGKRVAALLAGVVSKLSLLVILRLLVMLFPSAENYQVLLVLGVLGVISGELAAWRSVDLSRMLAYASIAQLGMVFIAFSIPGEAGIVAGLAVALHHMITKPGFFLLAHRWAGSISGLAGAAISAPWAAGIFVLLALSAVGVPPLPGFWAKMLLLIPLAELAHGWALLGLLVVLFSVVMEAGYLFRVVSVMYQQQPLTVAHEAHKTANLATAGLLASVLLAVIILLPEMNLLLQQMAAQVADPALYIQTVDPVMLSAGSGL